MNINYYERSSFTFMKLKKVNFLSSAFLSKYAKFKNPNDEPPLQRIYFRFVLTNFYYVYYQVNKFKDSIFVLSFKSCRPISGFRWTLSEHSVNLFVVDPLLCKLISNFSTLRCTCFRSFLQKRVRRRILKPFSTGVDIFLRQVALFVVTF